MTLQERITALHQQRDQTIAALNQVLGAIAICEQMQKDDAEAKAWEDSKSLIGSGEKPLPVEPGTYHDPLKGKSLAEFVDDPFEDK